MRYVRRVGYYRFSAFVPSSRGGQHDVIDAGASFDDVLDLYIFDRTLRPVVLVLVLVLLAIERIEVPVRAAMGDNTYRLAGPHCYEDAGHFENRGVHERLVAEKDRPSDERPRRRRENVSASEGFVPALGLYATSYHEQRRPPTCDIWEELSLGLVRSVYDALADAEARGSIARSIGLPRPVMSPCLESCQRVR